MEAPRSPDYAWAGAASSNLFFSEPGSRRSSTAHRTGAETTVPEGYSVYFSLLGVLAVVSGARQLAPLIKSFNKRRSRQECTGSSSRRICIFFNALISLMYVNVAGRRGRQGADVNGRDLAAKP